MVLQGTKQSTADQGACVEVTTQGHTAMFGTAGQWRSTTLLVRSTLTSKLAIVWHVGRTARLLPQQKKPTPHVRH